VKPKSKPKAVEPDTAVIGYTDEQGRERTEVVAVRWRPVKRAAKWAAKPRLKTRRKAS
jgi:hypothetical protein